MMDSIEMGIGGLSVPPGTHICGLFRGTVLENLYFVPPDEALAAGA